MRTFFCFGGGRGWLYIFYSLCKNAARFHVLCQRYFPSDLELICFLCCCFFGWYRYYDQDFKEKGSMDPRLVHHLMQCEFDSTLEVCKARNNQGEQSPHLKLTLTLPSMPLTAQGHDLNVSATLKCMVVHAEGIFEGDSLMVSGPACIENESRKFSPAMERAGHGTRPIFQTTGVASKGVSRATAFSFCVMLTCANLFHRCASKVHPPASGATTRISAVIIPPANSEIELGIRLFIAPSQSSTQLIVRETTVLIPQFALFDNVTTLPPGK